MIERDRAQRSILCVCQCGARELVVGDDLQAAAAAWETLHLEAHRRVDAELEREARRRAVAAAAARRRRHAD